MIPQLVIRSLLNTLFIPSFEIEDLSLVTRNWRVREIKYFNGGLISFQFVNRALLRYRLYIGQLKTGLTNFQLKSSSKSFSYFLIRVIT